MTYRHPVLVLAVAAAGCKKDKPAAQPENAKVSDGSAAAPSAGSVAPSAGSAAAPAAAGSVFASIEDYCKATTATFKKDECESPSEGDLCSCAGATADNLDGPLTAKGTGGSVLEAALVRVASSRGDFVKCGLALKFADGWRVQAGLFVCGEAPASHDGWTRVKIAAFTVAKDLIEIHGWSEEDGQGGVMDTHSKPGLLVRCEVAGSTATCKTTKS